MQLRTLLVEHVHTFPLKPVLDILECAGLDHTTVQSIDQYLLALVV